MQIAVVTNTLAGNGKAVKLADKLYNILEAKKITAQIFTEKEWDDRIYGFDQVWITGGDGTVNYPNLVKIINTLIPFSFGKQLCIYFFALQNAK